jgi:hypothetical protein
VVAPVFLPVTSTVHNTMTPAVAITESGKPRLQVPGCIFYKGFGSCGVVQAQSACSTNPTTTNPN